MWFGDDLRCAFKRLLYLFSQAVDGGTAFLQVLIIRVKMNGKFGITLGVLMTAADIGGRRNVEQLLE